MDQPVARHLQRAQRYIDEGQYAAASVVLVDYAEFTDTERLLRRVCAFCALPYEAQCLDASLGAEIVATPAAGKCVRRCVRGWRGGPIANTWTCYATAWRRGRTFRSVCKTGHPAA